MMQRFKNLKFRLLATLGTVLFALFYGFGYIVVHSLESSYQQTSEATLFAVLKDIKHDFNLDPVKEIIFNDNKQEFNMPILYAQVIAYDSLSNTPTIIQRSNDLKERTLKIEPNIIQQIFERPNEIVFSTMSDSILTHQKIYIGTLLLTQNEDQILFLQCAMPYDKHTPQVKEMTSTLWVGLSSLLIIILVLASILISKSLQNVQKVTNTAKEISTQDLHSTIPQTHIAYEIDDLIATFNTLLNELQNAYAQVKQFGQNASHELKTPLTIIQGEVDIGLRKERTIEEYQRILQKVAKEVSTLHAVIEKILFLSSTTKNDLKNHFSEVYLDEVLLDAIEEKRPLSEQKNLTLHVNTLEAVSVLGNAALLKIAIANLIDNAIKYTTTPATIEIALFPHELQIKDEGLGIKEEELAHIFEQFYRGNTSKQSTQGSGLGLAIVKNILDLHDFGITVHSQEGVGTQILITF
ncbi:Sensor kinase CusS [Sulfurospirillum diekertiae]|uniref:histidine kinase n=2 Tax=Sulfurospirillum diekertiae TaxID=1854492 RepID=A0A1Y0HNQ1_9BACT|nr:Sensor kinase CusS [Sulfurospirillum diekertiae]ASC94523.1 Sensor kinase CusS [Sulfurospirillum diekertiae]